MLWYHLLAPQEAQEWDRFLAGLKPGKELQSAIEAFRLSTDQKPDPKKPDAKPESRADEARRLLLEGLKEGGKE